MSDQTRPSSTNNGGALAGLRVLDTASLYAGPYLSTMLADHGADVVKIEPPGGDDYRHFSTKLWAACGRGKRSVVLDLRSDSGCDTLRRLAGEFDVMVFNLPPATLLKRGLDYDTLHALNPDLIVVQVSGYGLDGPFADRPGNGTLGEAFSGLTYMIGETDGPPVLPSFPLGDAITAYAGALGVLAALYHRLAGGGGGQLIDVNGVDAMLQVVGPVIHEYTGAGEPPVRLGSRLPGAMLRNVFRTSDGEWLAISASTPRHRNDLATLCGHEAWDDGNPVGDIEPAVRAWIASQTWSEVDREMVSRRLPMAKVNNAADLRTNPHLVARGVIATVESPEQGPIATPVPAPRLLGTPTTLASRMADLGEHTAEVLGA
ncbi:MAG: CaiB/BaiF CoA transferase family protein [Acidimicrobiia bacterium]